MQYPESDSFLSTNQDLFLLEKIMKDQNLSIEVIDDLLPGIIHINKIDDISIQFLNKKGCEMYERDLSDILVMGNEIFVMHTHKTTIEKEFPKIPRFLELSDDNATGSIFQRVQFYGNQEHEWVYTAFKKLKNTDCFIGLSHPISEMGKMGRKFKNILEENLMLRKNFKRFNSLTNREREVLSLIALGNTNKIIADKLFVSEHTIRTHRNRIWKKLDIQHLKDAIKFAEVFDLI